MRATTLNSSTEVAVWPTSLYDLTFNNPVNSIARLRLVLSKDWATATNIWDKVTYLQVITVDAPCFGRAKNYEIIFTTSQTGEFYPEPTPSYYDVYEGQKTISPESLRNAEIWLNFPDPRYGAWITSLITYLNSNVIIEALHNYQDSQFI